MTHLVLIRGLPGSGKSTLARKYAARGYVHVEADDYFMEDGEYRFDATLLPLAHRDCIDKVTAAMRAGQPCVVANTFTRKWEMEPYQLLASRHGYSVEVITCTGEWPNIHNVPQSAIERMRARWED